MEALYMLELKHRYKALCYANAQQIPVPKILENVIVPFESNSIRTGVLNIDHLNVDKTRFVQDLILNYDVFFLIEPWGYSPDIVGFTKYVSTSRYLNALYVRSSIKHEAEDVDFGFRLTIEDPIYFFYIPPNINKETIKLPHADIFGDFNWKSNHLRTPDSHETSRRDRTGTGAYSKVRVMFSAVEGTDHDLMSFIYHQNHKPREVIDHAATINAVYQAKETKTFVPKVKYAQRHIFDAWSTFKNKVYFRETKIFNANALGYERLRFWSSLLAHDPGKLDIPFESMIETKRIRPNHSNAKDCSGLNVNMILEIWKKWNLLEKNNLLMALKKDNLINGLLLKKKEFQEEKFNIKNFRIICILPTYLKLLESTINFNLLDKLLLPNFIGFRPNKSVEDVINFLAQNPGDVKRRRNVVSALI